MIPGYRVAMDGRTVALGGGVLGAVALIVGALAAVRAEPEGPDAQSRSGPSATPTTVSAPPDDSASDDRLLPDLRSLDAHDMRIEVTPQGRRLRFAAALANDGPGPLVLKPRDRRDCLRGEHAATQVLFVDSDGDGRFRRGRDERTRRQFAGCMLRHRGHDHWHFDAMAAYSLRRPDAARSLARRPKVSFCLRDNTRIEGAATSVRREHYGECSATRLQGISPGWVDVYGADLDGQWLALPRGVRDEVVCLDLEADPRGLVEEADETDNATSVAVRVRGTDVRRARAGVCR